MLYAFATLIASPRVVYFDSVDDNGDARSEGGGGGADDGWGNINNIHTVYHSLITTIHSIQQRCLEEQPIHMMRQSVSFFSYRARSSES